LPNRHLRDPLVDPVRSAPGHAPRAARGTESPSFARERHQFLVCAVGTARAQEAVRQNTAFKKSLALIFDKRRMRPNRALKSDLRKRASPVASAG